MTNEQAIINALIICMGEWSESYHAAGWYSGLTDELENLYQDRPEWTQTNDFILTLFQLREMVGRFATFDDYEKLRW